MMSMLVVREEFNKRKCEVEEYLEILKSFEDGSSDVQSENFFRILKANAIVMLYNLVESTLSNALSEVFDSIKSEKVTYQKVSALIRDVWLDSKYHQTFTENAHFHSYRNKAKEIVDDILKKRVIQLSRQSLGVSGNVDDELIRKVCKKLGVTLKIPEKLKGGSYLPKIKEKRNELAHGTLSFVECGRDYSYEDLQELLVNTAAYLEVVVNCFDSYISEGKFLNK